MRDATQHQQQVYHVWDAEWMNDDGSTWNRLERQTKITTTTHASAINVAQRSAHVECSAGSVHSHIPTAPIYQLEMGENPNTATTN